MNAGEAPAKSEEAARPPATRRRRRLDATLTPNSRSARGSGPGDRAASRKIERVILIPVPPHSSTIPSRLWGGRAGARPCRLAEATQPRIAACGNAGRRGRVGHPDLAPHGGGGTRPASRKRTKLAVMDELRSARNIILLIGRIQPHHRGGLGLRRQGMPWNICKPAPSRGELPDQAGPPPQRKFCKMDRKGFRPSNDAGQTAAGRAAQCGVTPAHDPQTAPGRKYEEHHVGGARLPEVIDARRVRSPTGRSPPDTFRTRRSTSWTMAGARPGSARGSVRPDAERRSRREIEAPAGEEGEGGHQGPGFFEGAAQRATARRLPTKSIAREKILREWEDQQGRALRVWVMDFCRWSLSGPEIPPSMGQTETPKPPRWSRN